MIFNFLLLSLRDVSVVICNSLKISICKALERAAHALKNNSSTRYLWAPESNKLFIKGLNK
jgi:hypothetical protein